MLKFRKLTLIVSDEAKSLVSDFLLGLDAMGVSEDVIEEKEGKETLVSAYFPKNAAITPVIKKLKNYVGFLKETLPGMYSGELEIEEIDRSSWEAWRQYLKTVRASRRIVITPPWEEYIPKEDEIVIEINPSMAFGTGHHETTRLCIRAIEERIEQVPVKSVLDVGCGSGILAIAAAKLGAAEAVGVDTDPIAIKEAYENSEKNSVSNAKYVCGYLQDIEGEFDLVVINISAEVVIVIREELKSRLKKGGKLIASGISYLRRDEVLPALEKSGFILDKEMKDGDWVAFIFGVDKDTV